jgi:ribose 5-phosphate isomerase B
MSEPMPDPVVYFAADHRGFFLKAKLRTLLGGHGFAVEDLGTDSEARCDASDFASRMAIEMAGKRDCFGVLICGTGLAMAMTANRYRHLRAALCSNATMARLARQHNDANILVLGADITGDAVSADCLEVFLKTEFLGGRYAERRDKLTALGGL